MTAKAISAAPTEASTPGAHPAIMPRPRFNEGTGLIEIATPIDGGLLQFKPGAKSINEDQLALLSPLGVRADWDPAYVVVFLAECQARGLDPWIGEAYLMKYPGGKYIRHIGIAGMRRKADETGEYEGTDQIRYCGPNGDMHTVWPYRDQVPYAAEVTVHRRGRIPRTTVALYDEFCPLEEEKVWDAGAGRKVPTGNGKIPTPMWRTAALGGKPTVMLGKCGEAAGFRGLFPSRFAGFYEPAETERMAAEVDALVGDELAQQRREAYAAAHGARTVDAGDVGAEVVEQPAARERIVVTGQPAGDDQVDKPDELDGFRGMTHERVRELLLAELDAQARLIGRDRAWMVRKWEAARPGMRFVDASVPTIVGHVHRFRVYVIGRLRDTGRHRLAEKYNEAPLVGTLAELFGHDEPWTVAGEQAHTGRGVKTTAGDTAADQLATAGATA